MDTFTPQPSPEPVEAPSDAVPAGPVCGACSNAALVNWRRRPTEDEVGEVVAAEQTRRDHVLLLADKQLPPPVFPPLPSADDMTRTIYACGPHAIHMEAASRIHQATCTAPNEDNLPDCDCTPEPHPKGAPEAELAESRLPAHWQTGSA